MARKRRTKPDAKAKLISVRVTPDVYDTIIEGVASTGGTVPDYVRYLLEQGIQSLPPSTAGAAIPGNIHAFAPGLFNPNDSKSGGKDDEKEKG